MKGIGSLSNLFVFCIDICSIYKSISSKEVLDKYVESNAQKNALECR